ncbi:MAG: F420-0:Gamma-glutamyl ligase, partial [Cyanobacteria bacterium J06626_26]
FAYIVKTAKSTGLKVKVDIQGPDLSKLKALWVKVHYLTYGPEGRIPKMGNVVVPLKYPDPNAPQNWRTTPKAEVLPIPTHLLGPLDSPIDTVKRYVEPYAKPGDIVTIGETPVAIMQGRWRHPSSIKPGWVAKRICYFFMPTSSLATACGMQTLVDLVGPVRVVYAFVVGAIAKKFLGRPGMFYVLAGDQARLIDDVTGTLPPYDQFIVLGPQNPEQIVQDIYNETGLKAAIVDVNDLKAVKILAATPGTDVDLVTSALLDNPAGNADEQTPVVLIHPKS